MRRVALAASIVLLSASISRATPAQVTLDTTQSSVVVSLSATISGNNANSNSTSRVAGTILLKVSPVTTMPTSLTLYDQHLELIDQINLTLTYRVFNIPVGTFHTVSEPVPNDIRLAYDPAIPGMPMPPVAVNTNGSFSVPNVPVLTTGILDYTATGIVCTAFQNQTPPQPCNGMEDLSSNGVIMGNFDGTVTVSPARLLTLISPINQTDTTTNGTTTITFSVVGSVRGSVTLPKRGDANLDGVVDARDVQPFINVLLNPAAATWDKRFAVDMNDDDLFDAQDAALLANCLLNNGCPN